MKNQNAKKLIIAIDGPAGAGKSTIAQALAMRLGYTYIDTGATLRAIAWKVREKKISDRDERKIVALARAARVKLTSQTGAQRVFIDGRDVTSAIRSPAITHLTSKIAAHAKLRPPMVTLWRRMGARGGVVMEGRDIGTNIFPQAEVKIFLDASLETRGARRYREARKQGHCASLKDTIREMQQRDRRDARRKTAPLEMAPDAVYIDTTPFNPDEVLRLVENLVQSRLRATLQ